MRCHPAARDCAAGPRALPGLSASASPLSTAPTRESFSPFGALSSHKPLQIPALPILGGLSLPPGHVFIVYCLGEEVQPKRRDTRQSGHSCPQAQHCQCPTPPPGLPSLPCEEGLPCKHRAGHREEAREGEAWQPSHPGKLDVAGGHCSESASSPVGVPDWPCPAWLLPLGAC